MTDYSRIVNELWLGRSDRICQLIEGDCLDRLSCVPDGSVDMVLSDPPYGTTQCKWDSVIPLDAMWPQIKRVIKPSGAIVIFACQPFTSALVMSNVDQFRYEWIWEKTTATGHLNANRMPMRAHENVCVFYGSLPTYNPVKTGGHPRKVSTSEHARGCKQSDCYQQHAKVTYDSTERYPRSVQVFSGDKQISKLHPTQKPVALMEYLVRTYTNEGDTVLDFAMGSGTTGVACVNLGRGFIGVEMNHEYFLTASRRVKPSD